jgi:uncharacterized glyoxalase superfamily protein PhnB
MSANSPAPAGGSPSAGAETLRASALSVSLTVKDIRRSLAWYRDVMGFTVDREVERDGKLRFVALTAGEARISINQDDGAKGWDRVKGEGFSLQMTTAQSIDAIAKGIKDRGGTLDTEPADMPWGVRMFRIRDPDGYKFGISSPRPA